MTEIPITELLLTSEGYIITTQLLAGNLYYLSYDVPSEGPSSVKDYIATNNAISITDSWSTPPVDGSEICFVLKQQPSLTEIPLIGVIANNEGYVIIPSTALINAQTYTLEYNQSVINKVYKIYYPTNNGFYINDIWDSQIMDGTNICFTLSDTPLNGCVPLSCTMSMI